MNRKVWNNEEIEKLLDIYDEYTAKELANIFSCTESSIYNKANLLGLKKSKEFISRIARERTSDSNHPSRKTRFKKGDTPLNKGKKQIEFMSFQSIERTKATRFRKGNVPLNYRPVGSERLDKDGYIMIKVADPNKWELKHRYIWEQSNGKIPKGYNIQFKDGNRLNISLDNLYMITKQEQISNNTIHRYPSEIKTAIRRINKINKMIKQ